jgi:hypothetical protein
MFRVCGQYSAEDRIATVAMNALRIVCPKLIYIL